jgi:hypothetical protein
MKIILLFWVTVAVFMLNASETAYARRYNVQSNKLNVSRIADKPNLAPNFSLYRLSFNQSGKNQSKIELLSSEFEEEDLDLETKWSLLNPISSIFNFSIIITSENKSPSVINFANEEPTYNFNYTYILIRTLRI